jgi:hypothetical protein
MDIQQFPVSRMVYPAYIHYDAHQVDLKTPRRLCLGQPNGATGDVGWLLPFTPFGRLRRHLPNA